MSDPFETPAQQASRELDVDRDRWGRYMLPNPASGNDKPEAWTRVTTFAKSIMDTYALGAWSSRMAVKGVSLRPDLYALAASKDVTDKKALDEIVEQAKDAAKSKEGSNLGTALHAFSEQVDRGEQVAIPAPWDRDIKAYQDKMALRGLAVLRDMIERVVVVPEYQTAGTLDRIIQDEAGQLYIADLKTGKDLSYSWGEIAVQLALYAHAPMMWSTAAKAYSVMPKVSLEWAYVMHVPAGQARCDIYRVNIAAGWEAARLCKDVRDWRARKDLAELVGESSVEEKPKRTRRAPAKKAPATAKTQSAQVAEKLKPSNGSPVLRPEPVPVEPQFIPHAPAAPEPEYPEQPVDYLEQMSQAQTREQIKAVWDDAKAAGAADPELKRAGIQRANQLAAPPVGASR